jgi:hypothetical protein
VDTGKSTSGYVTSLAGGAINWESKLQSIIAVSTTEAEYVGAVEAGKEIYWMRNILHEFGHIVTQASTLYIDNQSTIKVTNNPEQHGRMKHMPLRFFWLRDAVFMGRIAPVYIPTAEQVADILTKPLLLLGVQFCEVFTLPLAIHMDSSGFHRIPPDSSGFQWTLCTSQIG